MGIRPSVMAAVLEYTMISLCTFSLGFSIVTTVLKIEVDDDYKRPDAVRQLAASAFMALPVPVLRLL